MSNPKDLTPDQIAADEAVIAAAHRSLVYRNPGTPVVARLESPHFPPRHPGGRSCASGGARLVLGVVCLALMVACGPRFQPSYTHLPLTPVTTPAMGDR